MTGRDWRRTATFLAASVVAGLALALLAVALFPGLAGADFARRLGDPAATVPAAPATRPAPVAGGPPAMSVAVSAAATDGAPTEVSPAPPATPPASTLADVVGPQPPNFSYAQAVQASAPAVVNIYTRRVVTERLPTTVFDQFMGNPLPPRYRQRVQNALGSGVIVDRSGHIVTNNHVIAEATQISVQLADGRTANAQVIGRDPDTDLAVLKTDLKSLPVMRLGRSDTLQVGDLVLAIGNPLGLSQTVTHGIVSAKERGQLGVAVYESFIQTDAAINEGNSGGALVNGRGELVGINTAVLGKQIGAEGIGVAIPVELVRGVMTEILAHGRVIRGWIGIRPLDERVALQLGIPSGTVVLAGVDGGSPAAAAGLRIGDVVVKIDGQTVRSPQDALTRIAMKRPGARVKMTLLREDEPFDVELVVREPTR